MCLEKGEIRRKIKEQKRQMTMKEIETMEQLVAKRLEEHQILKNVSCFYCYVSYNQEVPTFSIINKALNQGILVGVPKIINGNMEFCRIRGWADLQKGYQGILEPAAEDFLQEPEALVIVPGLAFDYHFNRIGYGGGFYDRFFQKYWNHNYNKTALCYDFQVLNEIPSDLFDQKMDQILTPTRLLKQSYER